MGKPKFSVFLDFDGVLNDTSNIRNILKCGGLFASKNDKKIFNEESIDALNILISSLATKYDVGLVLTTFWRLNLDKCIQLLKFNGLQFDGNYDAIPFMLHQSRAKEIHAYIEFHRIENFCVIDDLPTLKKHFVAKNSIRTSMLNSALNKSKVNDYLQKFYPDLIETEKEIGD